MHLRGHGVSEAKIQNCVEKGELVHLLLSCNDYGDEDEDGGTKTEAEGSSGGAGSAAAAAQQASAEEQKVEVEVGGSDEPTPFERIAAIEAAGMGGAREGTLADRIINAELELIGPEGNERI